LTGSTPLLYTEANQPTNQPKESRMTYLRTITEAAGLLEPEEWQDNGEYLRGMCELIARTHPIMDMETDVRANCVRHEIAAVLGVGV
jgi:hypothetical protein